VSATQNPFGHFPKSNQEIDDLARDVAKRALAGTMTDKDARWALASLVYKSNIPEAVVGSSTNGLQIRVQLVRDSADYVREQLTKMIVGPKPKLDLKMLAEGSSLCGWARRIIAGARVFPKTNFDSRTRLSREVVVSDDTISSLVALRAIGDYGVSSLFNEEVEQRHDVVDEYALLAKGLREGELLHLSAEHICTVYAVAAPRRAPHVRNHRALLTRLDASENACRDDLYQLLDDETIARDSLAILFTNLTPEEIGGVVSLSPLSSQMLARSALTPVPPPRQTVVKTLRANVVKAAGGQRSANSLCRAYVNVVSEIDGSEFAPDAAHRQIKRVAERRADFANWNATANDLVKHGHLDLGETPDQVLTSLSRQVREISLARARRVLQKTGS
jgi:hypothetical protein